MAIETDQGFFVEIDGVNVPVPKGNLTGLEVMQAAGIPAATGLLELMEDGTQRQVRPEESFDLEHGPRFKKRPKFKRG